jgi:hypothetical protein
MKLAAALAVAAAFAATGACVSSLARLRAIEARLAALETKPPPRPIAPPGASPSEVAALRKEIETLRADIASRPPAVPIDADLVEKAVKDALARRPEVAGAAIEQLASEAARRTLAELAIELGLSADQIDPIGAILSDAARREAALLLAATTDEALKAAEAAIAELHHARDARIRERLTVEQRARYDAWLQPVAAPKPDTPK